MLRGRLLGPLAVGLLAVFAAPAGAVRLVNPDGTPAGGKWQRWADKAKVPTVRGPVLFVAPGQLCVYGSYVAAGCSEGPPRFANYELAASDRDSLYFELGHLFDWRYLTPRDRRYLARFWQAWGVRWWDSSQSIAHGGEDGLEAQFAAAYDDCAQGFWEIGGLGGGGSLEGPDVPGPPAIYPKTDTGTCEYISHLRERQGRHPKLAVRSRAAEAQGRLRTSLR